MAPDRSKPTERQREYLTFIRDFTDRYGMPPSFDEIGSHFLTTPPSVNSMVKMLVARGFLTRVPGAPRTLRVLFPLPAPSKSPSAKSRNAEIECAVRVGCMTIERLVPALKGIDEVHLHAALGAVRDAVDVALVTAGATDEQRDDAFDDIRRTAITAQGMVPERGRPGRRRRR
jgi:hypothetical protein